MGVPGNVFQRRPLEVTSHVREAGVRVLSFAVEDDHGLTQRLAVLTAGDVEQLHRALGAWLEEVKSLERAKLDLASDISVTSSTVTSRVTVIEFRKRVACSDCGFEHAPGQCISGGAA